MGHQLKQLFYECILIAYNMKKKENTLSARKSANSISSSASKAKLKLKMKANGHPNIY